MTNEPVWRFETAQFYVTLTLKESCEPYDGEDPLDLIWPAIEAGELVVFDSFGEVRSKVGGVSWGSLARQFG